MRAWVGFLVVLATLALGLPATAHPESAAPQLRADVLGAGHDPVVVAAHTQWQGFLALAPGSNVTAAFYQVCRVGQACFAPPAPAEKTGDTFRFDTSAYLANGRPVDYEPGWRLGVTWLLEERLPNGTTQTVRFPVGPDVLAPECQGEAALACAEAHYLAFDIAAEPRESPGLPGAMLLLVVAALAATVWRRP
ncbi:MAG: hypothetical protein WC876_02960 [Candidatus Thermoplasmatota archaeon]|jgi:hypothetical protein